MKLDLPTLEKMIEIALETIATNKIPFGDFNDALFHLNSLYKGRALDCRQILERYGAAVNQAVETIRTEKNIENSTGVGIGDHQAGNLWNCPAAL